MVSALFQNVSQQWLTDSVSGLVGLRCSAQTWAANSLSRSASYCCFISSSDSVTIGLEGLNTQLHSEQPNPSKFAFSTHTSLRGIARVCAYRCQKQNGVQRS